MSPTEIAGGTRTIRKRQCDDPTVANLSKQQKALRNKIYQSNKIEDRTQLRRERNHIIHFIAKRFKEIATQQVEEVADTISSTDDCKQMFDAAKKLQNVSTQPRLTVQSPHGNFIGTDKGKAEAIKKWFNAQFTDTENEPLYPFTC